VFGFQSQFPPFLLHLFNQGNIEIREELDEEELKQWRQQRKQKVREAKIKENQEEKGQKFLLTWSNTKINYLILSAYS